MKDVTWKREKLNSWSILKRKLTFDKCWRMYKMSIKRRQLLEKISIVGGVIVWGNCKMQVSMNCSWCLGWLLEMRTSEDLILSLWVVLVKVLHYETCKIICQGVVVLMLTLFTEVMKWNKIVIRKLLNSVISIKHKSMIWTSWVVQWFRLCLYCRWHCLIPA